MFAVIFEVEPKAERRGEYLELASFLKPSLEKIDGFIEIERFASRRSEGRVLSLSSWRDEKSVIRWRVQGAHHEVQTKGRSGIFQNYHLRVGEVTSDESPRRDTSLERLATLEPVFAADGSVTAGNSSPLNDGAAALLIMSDERARDGGFAPKARIVASSVRGSRG